MKTENYVKDVFIETIAESAERGANIVKQVLTFARGVSGESVPLQPKHLIRSIAATNNT